MLKELLMEIKEAPYISKTGLAQKLKRPLPLIEDAFSRLVQMGYLKEDKGFSECDIACGKCPYASFCNGIALKTMALTEKGERVLADKPG